jgi:hypothetical protein
MAAPHQPRSGDIYVAHGVSRGENGLSIREPRSGDISNAHLIVDAAAPRLDLLPRLITHG